MFTITEPIKRILKKTGLTSNGGELELKMKSWVYTINSGLNCEEKNNQESFHAFFFFTKWLFI